MTDQARERIALIALFGMMSLLLAGVFVDPAPILQAINRPSERSLRNQAWTKAQIAVTERLKAPATARFSPNPTIHVECPVDYANAAVRFYSGYPDMLPNAQEPVRRFIVIGYVDSENSFGALIRNRFIVSLLQNSTVWRVEAFKWDKSALE